MKKLIAISLSIFLILQIHCSALAETDINKPMVSFCNSREEFLMSLGVIDKEFLDKEYFTRSDIVKIMSRNIIYFMSPHSGTEECESIFLNTFHDMSKERDDFDDFFKLYNCGGGVCGRDSERLTSSWIFLPVIQGSNNLMRPDDLITWSEFVTLCIRVLNWDVFIYLEQYENYPNIDMGYPHSYFDMAEKIGFTNIKKEGYVTTKEACNLLYELIQAPCIFYSDGVCIPINVSYGQHYETIVTPCEMYKSHINTLDEETKIKEEYVISEDVDLLNRDVLIIFNRYTGDKTIRFDDNFVFKGDENGLPKEMYGDIIKLPIN